MSPKTPEKTEKISTIPYGSVVRSIMYTMLCIKPSFAYTLGITSRFQTDPEKDHWKVVKNILKYLKSTRRTMSWKTSKQQTIANSIIEVEYIIANRVAKEEPDGVHHWVRCGSKDWISYATLLW